MICGFATWAICAACGGDAVTPHRPVAPVAAASQSAPHAVAPATPATSPSADVATAPAAPSVVEPPPPEPAPPLPPCPKDAQRDATQKPDQVMQLLALSPSMTVVDLGSGSGYFLCHLSRAVGPRGHVIATDIDKAVVRDLNKRVARENLANTEVILAPANDVGIAAGSADRILLVNVWHHLPDRKRYATRIARALTPGGKVIVIDFKPAGHSAGHGIAPERVLAELAAGGIDAALVSENLPDQYVIIGSARAPSDARTP